MIKAQFKLTQEQCNAVQPLTDAMSNKIGAVLGQCWVIPTDSKYGTADFYYLSAAQYAIVDAALKEAIKLKETP